MTLNAKNYIRSLFDGALIPQESLAATAKLRPATVTIAPEGTSNGADLYTDGVADNVQIQAALDSLPSAGGTVLLAEGTYNLADNIAITRDSQSLIGQGIGATLLKLQSSANCNVIEITGTGVIQASVKRMTLDGNRNNVTNSDGIYISTPWQNGKYDAQHVFEDLRIVNCKNNAFEVGAAADTRALMLTRVIATRNDGNGFYMPAPSCTDNIFTDCIADTNKLNGFYIGCLNSTFTGCKSFFNGETAGSNHGFFFSGYNNKLANCEAQDNYQSGFYSANDGDATYGSQGNMLINCVGDSNGRNQNETYSKGVQLVNCREWSIIGGRYLNAPYGTYYQNYGISLEGTTTEVTVMGVTGSGNNTALISDTSTGTNYRHSARTFYDYIQVQTYKNPAPDHSMTIHQRATSGALGAALNVVSDNPATSAMLVTGVETALGTLKIKHIGQADGSDSSNASLSIDMITEGTAAQGIYVNSTATGGTIGQLLRLRNQTVDKFVVAYEGTLTMQGRLIVSNAVTPASAGASGVAGTIAWDSSYIYICVATDTWKRVAISTW